MVSFAEKNIRGLEKYSRNVWGSFLRKEFSSICNKRVLDLGCGFCRYTKELKENNDVIRVDKVNTPFVDIVCMAEELPFEDCYFDEVIAIGLLDYSDPEKTVNEIFRVLKKGGIVRVMVPNISNPYIKVAVVFGSGRGVKKAFSKRQIDILFFKKGFRVIKLVTMGFCFWVPTSILQDVVLPIFSGIDYITSGRYGNNIYLVAEKK